MKATVKTKDLKAGLKKAGLVASGLKKDHLQYFSNVTITAEKDSINLYAIGVNDAIRVSIPAVVSVSGKALLKCHKVKKIVSKLKAKQLELETIGNDLQIDIGSKILVPGLPPSMIPDGFFDSFCFSDVSSQISQFDGSQLKELHKQVFAFIGNNESRRNLSGLNVKMDRGNVVYTAADAFRITEVKTDSQFCIEFKDFILPRESFKNAVSIFDEMSTLWVSKDSDKVFFTSKHIFYRSETIPLEYPNLERLLNSAMRCTAEINRVELLDALDLLESLSDDKIITAKASFSAESLSLTTVKTKVDIGIRSDCNDPIDIGLSVLLSKQIVQSYDCDTIVIGFSEPERPVFFLDHDYYERKSLLMPIRLHPEVKYAS